MLAIQIKHMLEKIVFHIPDSWHVASNHIFRERTQTGLLFYYRKFNEQLIKWIGFSQKIYSLKPLMVVVLYMIQLERVPIVYNVKYVMYVLCEGINLNNTSSFFYIETNILS